MILLGLQREEICLLFMMCENPERSKTQTNNSEGKGENQQQLYTVGNTKARAPLLCQALAYFMQLAGAQSCCQVICGGCLCCVGFSCCVPSRGLGVVYQPARPVSVCWLQYGLCMVVVCCCVTLPALARIFSLCTRPYSGASLLQNTSPENILLSFICSGNHKRRVHLNLIHFEGGRHLDFNGMF